MRLPHDLAFLHNLVVFVVHISTHVLPAIHNVWQDNNNIAASISSQDIGRRRGERQTGGDNNLMWRLPAHFLFHHIIIIQEEQQQQQDSFLGPGWNWIFFRSWCDLPDSLGSHFIHPLTFLNIYSKGELGHKNGVNCIYLGAKGLNESIKMQYWRQITNLSFFGVSCFPIFIFQSFQAGCRVPKSDWNISEFLLDHFSYQDWHQGFSKIGRKQGSKIPLLHPSSSSGLLRLRRAWKFWGDHLPLNGPHFKNLIQSNNNITFFSDFGLALESPPF